MSQVRTRPPYGRWPSPVSAALLAGDLKLRDVCWDNETGALVWLEGRGDRAVLMKRAAGHDAPRELTRDIDVRGEVGYGGGDFAVSHGRVFFAERKSGRLWQMPLSPGRWRPITPAFGKAAAPAVSPDGRFVLFVHHDPQTQQDRLAVVDRDGESWPQILHQGADFYMQPRWGRHGDQLFVVYIAWNHPFMPWESSTLFLAEVELFARGLPRLGEPRAIAGGDGVAVFQPEVSADGSVVTVVCDVSGRWQLWRIERESLERRQLTTGEVEYGIPAWAQGMRTYGLAADGRRAFACENHAGFVELVEIDLDSGERQAIRGLGEYSHLEQIAVGAGGIACVASATRIPPRLVTLEPDSHRVQLVARASAESVATQALAPCEAVSWQSSGQQIHGLLYRPHPESQKPPGRAPPLLVFIHGGPTDQARATWDPRSQFFATRGYAVLWINYRGSSGYGRPYWQQLCGEWGVVDVEDAVSGAQAMVERGEADAERLVIAGGSAGGFTVLQAMINQPDAFCAGICYFGVADLFALARETHKFEQHYTDFLVGPLPAAADLYRARSPVFHAGRIKKPVAVFQGDEDGVVPKAQSDAIVAALAKAGVPHVYHVYRGEGHGFRKPETLEHFYSAIEIFLAEQVLAG